MKLTKKTILECVILFILTITLCCVFVAKTNLKLPKHKDTITDNNPMPEVEIIWVDNEGNEYGKL